MTAEKIIAEVRSIAEALAIRGVHPGEVSISVRYRVKQLLYQCPFAPWFKKGRRYRTKQGSAIFNGQPATIPVIKTLGGIEAVIDSVAVEICKGIIDHLNVANWKQMVSNEMTPQYHNWTPEVAEAAIRKAAQELPELCDKLEATKTAAVKVKSRKSTKTRDDEPTDADRESDIDDPPAPKGTPGRIPDPEKTKHASRANALRGTTPPTTWKVIAQLVNKEFSLAGDNAYADPLKGKRHIRSVHREHHGDKAQKKKRG